MDKKVKLQLVGLDGNAYFIMGAFQRQARKEGWTQEEINEVLEEAKSGDYDHLLQTIMKHCEDSVSIEEEEYEEDVEDEEDVEEDEEDVEEDEEDEE